MLENHPAVKWGAVAVPIIGTAVGIIVFLQTLVVQLDDQTERLRRIEAQVEQVGSIVLILREIESRGTTRFLQIERSFEELETGQHGLRDAAATSQDDLNFRIGSLHGRLLERGKGK